MANGKFAKHGGLNGKVLAMLLAMVLLISSVGAGTLAWLTDETNTKENVFTVGNIEIDLTETDRTYKMIPGHVIDKDPKVTVEADSEDAWVFVKVEKSDNFDSYLSYAIAEGWTALADDGDNNALTTVYYRRYTAADAAEYPVLAGNKVNVREDVTKEMMDAIQDGTVKNPTLTFTAYAIQYYATNGEAFDVADAWDQVKG